MIRHGHRDQKFAVPSRVVMSYSLYLKGEQFNRDAWLNDLSVAANASQVSPFSVLCNAVTNFQKSLNRPTFWLHTHDGLRGLFVNLRETDVELNIPAGGNPSDYGLAATLLTSGKLHGAKLADENEDPLEDESDASIMERLTSHQKRALDMFVWSFKQFPNGSFDVGGGIQFKVSEEDANADLEVFQHRFTERMKRYSSTAVSPLMGSASPNNGETTYYGLYEYRPTLMVKTAQFVHLPHSKLQANVPIADFVEALEGKIEDLARLYYVPEISASDMDRLIDNFYSRPPAGITLSTEDWMTLVGGPWLIFMIVATSEQKVDRKKVPAFMEALRKEYASASDFSRKVLEPLLQDPRRAHTGEETLHERLVALAFVLRSERIAKEDAIQMSAILQKLGRKVATASGGFLGFGSKISQGEAEALYSIERALTIR